MYVWSCFMSGYKTPFCECVHDRNVFFVMYHKFVRSPAPYHGILRKKLKSYSTCYDAYDIYQFSSENAYFYI